MGKMNRKITIGKSVFVYNNRKNIQILVFNQNTREKQKDQYDANQSIYNIYVICIICIERSETNIILLVVFIVVVVFFSCLAASKFRWFIYICMMWAYATMFVMFASSPSTSTHPHTYNSPEEKTEKYISIWENLFVGKILRWRILRHQKNIPLMK